MANSITGVLVNYWSMESEGASWWSVQDNRFIYTYQRQDNPSKTFTMKDLEGLIPLIGGEKLTIFDPKDPSSQVWDGIVEYIYDPHDIPYPGGHGGWLHVFQVPTNVPLEEWCKWFCFEYPAKLEFLPGHPRYQSP